MRRATRAEFSGGDRASPSAGEPDRSTGARDRRGHGLSRDRWLLVAAAAALAAGCGGDKKAEGSGKGTGTGTAEEPAPTLPVPALGVASPKLFNYPYEAGNKEYEKALKAYKAEPRDWAGVRAAAEATLAKDATHLEARWVLGEALAQAGEAAKAAEQLSGALAADWMRWGPSLAQDPELAGFLDTPHGKALLALNATLKDQFAATVKTAPLVLGRRSTFKMPKPGTNYAATRGELYAYDLEHKRFLRLTHTDHQLAAFVRAPGGDELLLLGFDKAELPDPKKAPDAPPLLAKSWLKTFSLGQLADTSARANVGKARAVTAWYGTGDQVVVGTSVASGRWGLGKQTVLVLDRSTGKLTKTQAPQPPDHVELTFDEIAARGANVSLPPGDLDPSITAKLMADGGGPIGVGADGKPALASFTMSPGKTRVAFATATDPCNSADDAAKPTLYVADAKTAQIKHVLTAASRFAVTWIDDDRLIYEDGSGGLRLYDAAAMRETAKIAGGPGLALRTLSPTTAPLCRKEPIAAEPDDGTDGESLPPEESPASNPATTPK